MKRRLLTSSSTLLLVVGISIFTSNLALAEKWMPYQFKGNEHFEYVIRSGEDAQTANFILDIAKKEKDSFEVSSTSKWLVAREELGAEILGGFWAGGGLGLAMFFVNPMYSAFFSGLDLKVGEKMSFYGAGVIKVVRTEKIAGRQGFVCEFIAGEKDKLKMEWVIDPALPMPLRTKIFDDRGNVEYETKLLRYSTH